MYKVIIIIREVVGSILFIVSPDYKVVRAASNHSDPELIQVKLINHMPSREEDAGTRPDIQMLQIIETSDLKTASEEMDTILAWTNRRAPEKLLDLPPLDVQSLRLPH